MIKVGSTEITKVIYRGTECSYVYCRSGSQNVKVFPKEITVNVASSLTYTNNVQAWHDPPIGSNTWSQSNQFIAYNFLSSSDRMVYGQFDFNIPLSRIVSISLGGNSDVYGVWASPPGAGTATAGLPNQSDKMRLIYFPINWSFTKMSDTWWQLDVAPSSGGSGRIYLGVQFQVSTSSTPRPYGYIFISTNTSVSSWRAYYANIRSLSITYDDR